MTCTCLLIIALLALSVVPSSAGPAVLQARAGKGIVIDGSCQLWSPNIKAGLQIAKDIAKLGFRQAKARERIWYQVFFRPEHQSLVMSVFKNIIRAINGYGPEIRIVCAETPDCIPERSGFLYWHDDWREDYINLCLHALVGPKAFPVTESYCGESFSTDTVANVLLHETIHFKAISDFSRMDDFAEDADGSMTIRKGLMRDSDGIEIQPTWNVYNYVIMAELAYQDEMRKNTTICPPGGLSDPRGGELRKLQNAGNLTLDDDGNDDNTTSTNATAEEIDDAAEAFLKNHTIVSSLGKNASWIPAPGNPSVSTDNDTAVITLQGPSNASDYIHQP